MEFETKLRGLAFLEFALAAFLFSAALYMPDGEVSAYYLWEIFPAIFAAGLTTFGLKNMKEKT